MEIFWPLERRYVSEEELQEREVPFSIGGGAYLQGKRCFSEGKGESFCLVFFRRVRGE